MAQYIRPDFWVHKTTVLWAACLCVCVCARVSLAVVIAAQLTRFGRTMGRMTMKSTHIVLGHSLVRSLVHSHRTARFTRAFRCAHSFVRSFARPLTRSRVHGKEVFVYELNASTSCSFNGEGDRGGKKQFFPLFPLFFCVFLRGKLTMRK